MHWLFFTEWSLANFVGLKLDDADGEMGIRGMGSSDRWFQAVSAFYNLRSMSSGHATPCYGKIAALTMSLRIQPIIFGSL